VGTVALVFSQTRTPLVDFVRIDDFVPCDFNGDGVVDILALNRRISDGFGYVGAGNGLFVEGPSFDLPFWPAATIVLGSAVDNGIVLANAESAVSFLSPALFAASVQPARPASMSLMRLGAEGTAAPLALIVEGRDRVQVFAAEGASLAPLGEYAVSLATDALDWFRQLREWSPGTATIPVLPESGRALSAAADMNNDGDAELVYCEGEELHVMRDSAGGVLSVATAQLAAAVALRLVDIDKNGYLDAVVLLKTNVLEVCLAFPAN